MGGPTRVYIEGGDRLARTLKEAGASLDEMKALHAEVGETLEAGAEPLIALRTGALAGTLRSSGTKREAVLRAGGGSVPYAGVIEFGWPARNIAPHPALTASLANQEDRITELYEREVDRLLGKVKGS